MSSCGLKNSLCQDTSNNDRPPEDPLHQRFSFVDGDEGLWTTDRDYGSITCPVGGLIVFFYPVGTHDIVQVEIFDDWNSCNNIENATLLSPRMIVSDGSSDNSSQRISPSLFSAISYYYMCSTPGETAYLTCSVPGHCKANQKVVIRTSETEYAYDRDTGNWTLHVDSQSRVLKVLGYHTSSEQQQSDNSNKDDTAVVRMERGYQTEELANITTNLVWCALDHCPHFALDFDAVATKQDCESTVFTLLGFLSRKRPLPQWEVSEKYYQEAIERGGKNNCTARSYLSQLYLNKGDWINASEAIISLCSTCQDQPALILQARHEYNRIATEWGTFNFDEVCGSREAISAAVPTSTGSTAILSIVFFVAYLCIRYK